MKCWFKIITLLVYTLVGRSGLCASSLTQEGAEQSAETKQIVDRIVLVKSSRTMTLESNGHILKTYKVALGGDPIGPKERQGDHKTPEGEYVVDAKNSHSQFYLALHI